MESLFDRRAFLKGICALAATELPSVQVYAASSAKNGIEALLHKSLPQEVKNRMPLSADQLVEYVERSEQGKLTQIGRFLRTYRWHNLLSGLEKELEAPKGLLAGLVLHESNGSPWSVGPTADAGLWMFIPETGRGYGLKIGPTSSLGLRKLLGDKKYDYTAIAQKDERFDILKSAAAAKKQFVYLKGANATWNKALSAYNQGKAAPDPSSSDYVTKVREAQAFYNCQLRYLQDIAEGTQPKEIIKRLYERNRGLFWLENGIWHYRVIDGDIPGTIAALFNSKHGARYGNIKWTDIHYKGKKVIPEIIVPGQVVYWKVPKR
ncbi:MAG TPA: transglycosylase SLT domain-containing protein [Candidatus Nanoarchaeia archaeon]|nr:transglycosylase SLT domain-containing protein [Candidatus Nanoarchaeia archaeon]